MTCREQYVGYEYSHRLEITKGEDRDWATKSLLGVENWR